MTLIVALHLDDYIMIASDRRLSGSPADRNSGHGEKITIPLRDDYQKVQLWDLGVMIVSGDSLMLEYFCRAMNGAAKNGGVLCPYSVALAAKCTRMQDGTSANEATGTAIFSLWDVDKFVLMAVHIEDDHIIFETIEPFHTLMTVFKPYPVKDVANVLASKLLSINNFNSIGAFCEYHFALLEDIVKTQSAVDFTVSASFDWMIQDMKTGEYHFFNCPREEPMPVTTKIWVTTHIDPITNAEKTLWNYHFPFNNNFLTSEPTQ